MKDIKYYMLLCYNYHQCLNVAFDCTLFRFEFIPLPCYTVNTVGKSDEQTLRTAQQQAASDPVFPTLFCGFLTHFTNRFVYVKRENSHEDAKGLAEHSECSVYPDNYVTPLCCVVLCCARLESKEATRMRRSTSCCVWNADAPEVYIAIIIIPAFHPNKLNKQT
jgi:hypothetical protein